MAVQVLYQSEMLNIAAESILVEKNYIDEQGVLTPYAEELIRGTERYLTEIDRHLIAVSENWSLTRMPAVDRALLRLACYEMLYVDDVPISVTINEIVELAKAFGGEDDSPRFVNGVLGRIARHVEQGEPLPEIPAEPSDAAAEEVLDAGCEIQTTSCVEEEAVEDQPREDVETTE